METRYCATGLRLRRRTRFWIVRSRANGENFREDRTWSYNSVNALSEQFPYLSRDRIRRTLASLMKQGIIQSGNFNDRATDRTLWYAFVDEEAFLQDVSELAKSPNGKGKSANAHVAKSPNAAGDSAKSLTTTDVNANKKADGGRGTRLTKDWKLSTEAIDRTVAKKTSKSSMAERCRNCTLSKRCN